MQADDLATPLQTTVRQPGSIWCYSRTRDGEPVLAADPPPIEHPFRWLHLNLSDQRSLRWLEQEAGLPPPLHALMLARDGHPLFVAAQGAIGLVVHDFERGLDPDTIGRIDALHVVLTPDLLVTGRYKPLYTADLMRARLEAGAEVRDAPSALGFLLGALVDSFAKLTLDLSTQLLAAESDLMSDDIVPDTRELIGARRRSAQLHRMIGGLRAVLQRMEREPGVPAALEAVPETLLPRLAGLEADILSAQQQLRLLREELDLQAAQRTNQNVYLLSILTALMMPATLVTGFFGMNTSDLPFAQGHNGTLMATVVALFSGGLSYLLLRTMGLIRRQ
ncbi:MAG TPA: CorA family divalent cation transporter [Sphingomonas sp.]